MKKEKDYNDGEPRAKEYMDCPACKGIGYFECENCGYTAVECDACKGEGSIHNPDWDGDE